MSKKIKICAITTISKTMDWFVVDSMRNLSDKGFDVSLLCDMDEDFKKRNSDFAKCYPVKMSRGIDPQGAVNAIIYMYDLFKKEKFDMILFTTPNASLYASVAGKMAGIKHRVYNQWGLRYVGFFGIKRTIFKMLEKRTCSLATSIRSSSPKNMEFAVKEKLCDKDKISVIGVGGTVGVDLKEYDIDRKFEYREEIRLKWGIKNEFLFGFVGRINIDKGINELLGAFKRLSEEKKDLRLMLVGMEDDLEQLNPKIVSWAKNSSNVIFTGNVDKEDVCKYMAAFDILVHPTYREGFGKVIQEAMAMSTPVITTNVLGASEVIENHISGRLVEARDTDDLYAGMKELMSDRELMSEYALNGRKRVEKYFDRNIMLNNIWEDYVKELGLQDY